MKRWLGPLVVVILVAVLLVLAWPRPDVLIDQTADSTSCDWGIISSSANTPRDAVQATVNHVVDGETLSLDTLTDPDLPVRLSGINAPEIDEPEGENAANFLGQLLPEGTTVYTDAGRVTRDSDGHTLLFVWKASGELVNISLLYSGGAETSFTEGNTARRVEFEAADDSARDAGLGIWGPC